MRRNRSPATVSRRYHAERENEPSEGDAIVKDSPFRILTGRQGLPLGLFVAALSFLACIRPLLDPDAFWMLAGGRLVLGGSIPTVNTLSHTFADYPWHFTQWLSAALFALSERVGGLGGVVAAVGCVAAAAFLCTLATARRYGELFRWWLYLPFFLLALAATRYRFTPRGDIFTIAGIVAVPLLWAHRPKRLALWSGFLGVVWVNMHAGAVIGLLVWGAVVLSCLLRREKAEAKEAFLSAAAFFAGTLVNPSFFYPYVYLYTNALFVGGFPVMIDELARPGLRDFPLLYCYLALTLPALVWSVVKRDFLFALLYLFFGVLALNVIRLIPYFFLATLAGAAAHTFALQRALAERMLRHKAAKLAAAAVFALAVTGLAAWGAVKQGGGIGVGADTEVFPEGACDYLRRVDPPGRLFNEFDQGGYVAWRLHPGRGVYIDGRGTAYPLDFFKQAMAGYGSNVRTRLDDFGVDVAIVQRRPFGGNIDLGLVFDRLGWRLVYIEGPSYVFVRPGSQADYRTRGDIHTVLLPWEDVSAMVARVRQDPVNALRELSRIEIDRLVAGGDFRKFGIGSYLVGANNLGEEFFLAGMAKNPDDPAINLDFAMMAAMSGNRGKARELLLELMRLHPSSAEAARAREKLPQL